MYVFHFASLQFISNCCSSGSCLSTLPTNTGGKITVVSTKASHFCTVLKRSKSLQSFRMVFSAFQLLLSSALAKTLHASPKALASTRISAPFKPRAEWKRTRGHKRWQNRFDVEMENRNSDNVKCIKMYQNMANKNKQFFEQANKLRLQSPGFPTQPRPGQTGQTGQTHTKSPSGLSGVSGSIEWAVETKIQHLWPQVTVVSQMTMHQPEVAHLILWKEVF